MDREYVANVGAVLRAIGEELEEQQVRSCADLEQALSEVDAREVFALHEQLETDQQVRYHLLIPIEDAAVGDRALGRIDVTRALEQLKPRERSLLWLAYAQGFSHEEIAAQLGLRTGSLKALLFRARRRLVGVLGDRYRSGGRRG